MSLGSSLDSLGQADRAAFEARIRDQMAASDRAYDAASDCYGFQCRGCEENCCGELFYHHTLSEYLLLSSGMETLADDERRSVVSKAVDAAARLGRGEEGVFCPLHEEGRCLLYDYRPMICRLHGVPHVLTRPGFGEQSGTGCHCFPALSTGPEAAGCRLDRTPLYSGIAGLEIELRQALGFSGRIRMTVADMLVDGFGY